MADVIEFKPEVVGDGYRFDPDEILEAAKGAKFETLAVIGQLETGELWVSGNANAGETLVLIERAKHCIIFDED